MLTNLLVFTEISTAFQAGFLSGGGGVEVGQIKKQQMVSCQKKRNQVLLNKIPCDRIAQFEGVNLQQNPLHGQIRDGLVSSPKGVPKEAPRH